MRLEGKTAVVTGGARGIGAAIARCLAEEGASVAILDLDEEAANATAGELGRGSIGLSADAADASSMQDAVGRAARELGGLDVLVNNAGGGRGEADLRDARQVPPFTNLEQTSWEDSVRNNLTTAFAGAKAAIPHLEARGGGAIVNIASVAAILPTPGLPAYGAAKAGVIQLTRTLALELAPKQVRVNAICPGLVWTRSWERLATFFRDSTPELRHLEPRDVFLQRVRAQVPMGVEQTPEQIGRLAAFLVSPDAATITGQIISVDGGIQLARA